MQRSHAITSLQARRLDPSDGGLNSAPGRAVFALGVVFVVLILGSAGLRVWAKHVRRRRFELHDWLLLAAVPWGLGLCVICFTTVILGGIGLPFEESLILLGPSSITVIQKIFFASAFIWVTSTQLVRLSLLHLYTTIFPARIFRYMAGTVALLSTLFWLGYVINGFAFCRPVRYNWDKTIPGTCGSVVIEELSSGTINLILDLFMVILPLPALWRLQATVKKRLLLMSIFCIGFIVCGVNIARIVIIETVHGYSIEWGIGIIAMLEGGLGIVVASLPLIGPLLLSEGKRSKQNANQRRQSQTRYRTEMTKLKGSKDPWSMSAVDRSVEDEFSSGSLNGSWDTGAGISVTHSEVTSKGSTGR